ncbi:MAG: hypothetical protein WC222_02535 [Parachlamydiales bacterium]|jgi:hypothetical protein
MSYAAILNLKPFNDPTYWTNKILEKESFIRPFAKVILATSFTAVAISVYYVSAVPLTAATLTFLFGVALYNKSRSNALNQIQIAKDDLSQNFSLSLYKLHGLPFLQYHLKNVTLDQLISKFNGIVQELTEAQKNIVTAQYYFLLRTHTFDDAKSYLTRNHYETFLMDDDSKFAIFKHFITKASTERYEEIVGHFNSNNLFPSNFSQDIIEKLNDKMYMLACCNYMKSSKNLEDVLEKLPPVLKQLDELNISGRI